MDDHPPRGSVTHEIVRGIVHLHYVGAIGSEELIAAREAFLADPRFAPGMSFLVDFREASLAALDSEGIRLAAAHGARMARAWGPHRTAVVTENDHDFGVSRMFEVVGARPGLNLEVFRRLEDAVAWLEAPEQTPGPTPKEAG